MNYAYHFHGLQAIIYHKHKLSLDILLSLMVAVKYLLLNKTNFPSVTFLITYAAYR